MGKNNKICMDRDVRYMRRALELAFLGIGKTAPNPMVGAVIVYQDHIIGEGYHEAWGKSHAEVMAIGSVQRPELLRQSTLYVTLEPCSHHGKTPPCVELILRYGIPRVVVAMEDPYPEVSGRGIERLRTQGIEVCVGLMKTEASRLNAGFVWMYQRGRPFISLKWAESADGYIDRIRKDSNECPQVFSSAYRQRLVHRARLEHQAILVGYRTALLDNPSLNNRFWGTSQPLRMVLDPRLDLPLSLGVVSRPLAPTYLLYDPQQSTERDLDCYAAYPHVRLIAYDSTRPLAEEVCRIARDERILSILIEGGSQTLQAFVQAECYDHIEVEHSSISLGAGITSPQWLEHL